MTDQKGKSQRAIRRDMNEALDNLLSDADRSQLAENLLTASADDVTLWNEMKRVDRLLSSEPMLQAPSNFAAKVMASIAAKAQGKPYNNDDLRAAVMLLLMVVLLLPIVGSVLLFAQSWLIHPAALGAVLTQIGALITSLLHSLTLIVSPSALWLTTSTAILSALVGATAMRWLLPRQSPTVYRIPVMTV